VAPGWVGRVRAALRREQQPLAIAQGVRTAVVTVAPLIAGDLVGHPWLYSWAALGAFQASLADNGGPYRLRATSMALAAAGGALGVFIGSEAGRWPVAAVAVAVGAALFSGIVRVYGSAGTSAGLLNMSIFLVGLGYPEPNIDVALHRAALYLGGGVVAAILALVLWPFQPHSLVRRAVGLCYARIADLARHRAPNGALVRAAIEDAREHLAAVRGARDGSLARGEQLLLLLQTAERILGLLVALPDLLDVPGSTEMAQKVLAAVANVADEISVVVPAASEQGPIDVALAPIGDAPGDAPGEVSQALRRLWSETTIAAELADAVATGRPLPIVMPTASDPTASQVPSLRDRLVTPLRGVFSWQSLTLRHAVRLAIGVGIAELVAMTLRLPRGYWLTLTTGLILQPYAGATAERAMQRVVGTVLGGVIAAVLTTGVHGAVVVTAVLFPLTVLTLALRPVGYGYFTLFLTPLFVLIAEGSQSDPKLAAFRVLNTVLGGALAMVVAATLWPDWEGEEMPQVLAAAIDANRRFLAVVLSGDVARYNDARRAVGLANGNSDAALQRVVAEGQRAAALVEPASEVTVLMRRMTATVAALAVISETSGGAPIPGATPAFSAAADAALNELAGALRALRAPTPVAVLAPDGELAPTAVRLLDRIARQCDLLQPAVQRLVTARASIQRVGTRIVPTGAPA
jgi:uncharacterized membrane protein YccC